MPNDDSMLAQGTVEFRQAERDHANGRDRTPAARCPMCGDPAYLCACENEESTAVPGVSDRRPGTAEGDKTT